MIAHDKIYVNGAWVKPNGAGTIQVFDSITEEVMGTIPEGNAQDVDAAAKSAAAAFPSWSALAPAERAAFIDKIGDGLAARMDEIAAVISKETGMSSMLSKLVQVGLPINSFKQAAAVAKSFTYEEEVGSSAASRHGTTPCTKSPPRWRSPWQQAAPWY